MIEICESIRNDFFPKTTSDLNFSLIFSLNKQTLTYLNVNYPHHYISQFLEKKSIYKIGINYIDIREEMTSNNIMLND